jgi:uncharacterized protein
MAELSRRLRRSAIAWLGKLLSVRDTPDALARGLAVGFFFGVSFLWGLQIVLAVAVAHLLRGNKVIAAALTAVSNPLTSLPLYAFCYWVGQLLLGTDVKLPDLAQLGSLDAVLALGPTFFLTMFTGTTLVGLVGSVGLYFGAHRIFPWLQLWHGRRRGRQRQGKAAEQTGRKGERETEGEEGVRIKASSSPRAHRGVAWWGWKGRAGHAPRT